MPTDRRLTPRREGWTNPAQPRRRMQVRKACVSSRARPDVRVGVDTEMLFGEPIEVIEITGGWAWVVSQRDGYVGWTEADGLTDRTAAATHRVTALATHVYPIAPAEEGATTSMKRPALTRLTIGAWITAVGPALPLQGARGPALPIIGGGAVYTAHLAPIGSVEADVVSVAERLIGVPYLWGGRSGDGLDCSALVQMSLEAAGRACPRDTDMQEGKVEGVEGLGVPLNSGAMRRGDLVFWDGHVGLMRDETHLIHANAHHMAVAVEPVAETIARLEAAGEPVTSRRRLT